ncbi:MAG: hypothetical protein IH939_12010 [Acidobacteria bacterium]|nr:hypothetical protein [Acidobacteriota bacterium]
MRQYLDAKRQHRDAIVFFRMGDFYEMFYEDALTASRALDITLTSRSKDAGGGAIPMCGVPHHAADSYVTRLVKKGFRVAICEQVEDPKKAKGIVRREVVRVVSPGTFIDTSYLEDREPTLLMGLVAQPGAVRDRGGAGSDLDRYGMALLDVSTGEFTATGYRGDTGRQALADEIAVLRPREVLLSSESELRALLPDSPAPLVTAVEPSVFDIERARDALTTQLDTAGLEEAGGTLFLTLELVEGEDLSERLKRGKVPVDEQPLIDTLETAAPDAAFDGFLATSPPPARRSSARSPRSSARSKSSFSLAASIRAAGCREWAVPRRASAGSPGAATARG